MMLNLCYLTFLSSVFIPIVYGYGYNAHGYLGGLSDKYLGLYEPKLYKNITNLISSDIHSISSWADKVKRNKKYAWTSSLHYIDILECNLDKYDKYIIDKYCENNCIISAIKDLVNSLKYNINYNYKIGDAFTGGAYILTPDEQLKFLIHFIQDFNQPMHLLGYSRGGNSLKVNMYMDGKNRTTNMHFIWDSLLPEYYIDNYAYTVPIERIYLPINFTIDNLLETILDNNIKDVSCKIYPDTNEPIVYLIFNDYFKDEYFKLLFDNYHKMITLIVKYIFE